jgi:peptidyl-dipeptidase A
MHQHIATQLLQQDPHACNYFGNPKIGAFLKSIMVHGAAKDWRSMLRETTGDELNAKAMVLYFSPLLSWLKQENKGRLYSLPEKI